MPPIQYSLVYEHSWWEDVDRIEPDHEAWEEMIFGAEDVLERIPEMYPIVIPEIGGRILPTQNHSRPKDMPAMYVLYVIEEPAPDGKVSMRRVVTAEDIRAGLYLTAPPGH